MSILSKVYNGLRQDILLITITIVAFTIAYKLVEFIQAN